MADATTLTITINDTPTNVLAWINQISRNIGKLKTPKTTPADVQFATTHNNVVAAITTAVPPADMASTLSASLTVPVPVLPS